MDTSAGVAIGHRRLAVLDLSSAGRQPMLSPSGRYVTVFNGEIYNHLEMRDTLPASQWRGTSDTETLVAAMEHWGLEATLRRSVGMFAIAVWDRQARSLLLARDRMGEKPLYYGWQGESFLFASELNAIVCHPDFADEIDPAVVALYMRDGYVPAPRAIYRGMSKLLPGSFVRISAQDFAGSETSPVAYWTLRDACAAGRADPFVGTEQEAELELERRLLDAISLQVVADVPLGALLSGGVDSSLVVALMQAQASRPIRTFTIGFVEDRYDEAPHARRVAQHLRTEHAELYVSPGDAMHVIPKLPAIYGEPFGDASAIPTFLVAQLARRDVTVALSGDGGDELFGGYTRYRTTAKHWSRIRWMPHSARQVLAHAVRLLPGVTDRYPAAPAALASSSDVDFYRALVRQWTSSYFSQLAVVDPFGQSGISEGLLDDLSFCERMMLLDSLSYLTDDVLCKVDRAAMSVSLETRVPLLDHRVVSFAWSLPLNMKVHGGQGKAILRRILDRYVPSRLTHRPKMGFGVPVDDWLRGPLREWAEDLLDARRLKAEGYLDHYPVRYRWQQHCSGRFNWRDPLWIALMFQAWLRERQRARQWDNVPLRAHGA